MVASLAGYAIGSAVGGMLRERLGSMFGSNSNSAMTSYILSKKLQEHQYELNRMTRQTAYQDTRYSLENAGYNPLLAVGQQAQGGTFGASLSATDPKTENLQNSLQVAQANSQVRLNSAQAYNAFMQGNLTTAQANNLISQSRLNSAQQSLVNLQSNAQAINNLHLPSVLKSQIRLNNNQAQASIINAQANQTSALANQMNAQTNKMVGKSSAWRNYNQSLGYSTHGSIGPVSFSHTGNPNLYSLSTNSNSQTKYHTEYINGKPVSVRVLR